MGNPFCPHCGYRLEGTSPTHELVKRAASDYGISARLLMSRSQEPNVATARAIVAYILRHEHGLSYPRIGTIIDRDHTSVIPMVRKIEKRVAESIPFAMRVRRIAGEKARAA